MTKRSGVPIAALATRTEAGKGKKFKNMICFQYRDNGKCDKEDCQYMHVSPDEAAKLKMMMAAPPPPPPAAKAKAKAKGKAKAKAKAAAADAKAE